MSLGSSRMGKRGLCLALDESRKKQKSKPKDHYEILKISRSANAQQIRQAYRQRALETHPDRLVLRLCRQPTPVEAAEAVALYQQIVEAFELLADSDARRIYDVELGGSHGSGSWEEEHGGDQKAGYEAEAQLLLHGYLFHWQEISLAQPSQTLIALRNLLSAGAGDAQEDSRGTTKENLDPCMFARPRGYWVQMSWSTLTVVTTATTSLAQALSWRASLTAMRHEAKRRLQRSKADGETGRVPLLDSELKALLEMQPDIRLMFRYQVPFKKIEGGERIPCRLTLFTPRLELATQMRDEMSAVTSKRKLEEVVASYKNTVAWEKKKAKQYFDKVLQEINKTLAARLLNAEDQLQKCSARGALGSEVHQRFCSTLGLESSAQIRSAIANLQQVPIPERSRRVKALLAKAKALPAPPPAVLPVAPATARRSRRGRTWTGGLLPRETMATIVSGLPFFDLAQCRPASKGMLSVSHDCYWRCREMSLPLDPSVLGGFRRNRAGRIYYKTDALTVTLRFVAQPKVISTVERLNLENMTGQDVGERLFGCLKQIKHLQFVLLPATGWNDSKSLQKIRRLLSQRGIEYAIAKIR